MSENSIARTRFQRGADHPRFCFGIRLQCPRGGELRVEIAELLVRQRRIVVADEQIGLGAVLLDLAFRLGHAGAQPLDLTQKPSAGAARLVLLGGLLHHQVGLGDRIGDLRGELGVLRLELDRDHARLLHLEGGEPLVVALEDPLLGRHLHRILDDAEDAEDGAEGRGAAQHGIEFRPLRELELLDHLAGNIARENELHLAGHRLLVDGGAALERLLRVRPQEDVLAGLDQDARFGLVSRRDVVDRREGEKRGDQREPDDQEFLAPERAAESPKIDLGVGLRYAKPTVRLYARLHDHLAPTRTTRDS